jgi:hypothetical protein
LFNQESDLFCDHTWVLVLPYTDSHPTCGDELSVRVGIATSIATYLFLPITSVCSRSAGPVGRTTVPKASVDEDRNASRPEDDVGPAPQMREWGNVDPVSEPGGVKQSSYGQLGLGVSGPLALHSRPNGRCAGPGGRDLLSGCTSSRCRAPAPHAIPHET